MPRDAVGLVADEGSLMPSAIPAAGTIPWRLREGDLQVALIHRPRYRDWSWPKGKVDPGEEWPVTAVRETREETGLSARLGLPLPEAAYMVISRGGVPDHKRVRYWAATVHGKPSRLAHEVDEVAWLSVADAYNRLDYARDRDQLLALTQAHQVGRLDTWPLAIVRHAKALSRADYDGRDDQRRPLDGRGQARSTALVPVLAAYGITRVVSSPAVRCVETMAPYAASARLRLRTKDGLSEEGFEADPARATRHLERLVAKAEPAAVCSHGPVMPALLRAIRARLDDSLGGADEMTAALAAADREHLVKGEALICHMVGAGPRARVVAVERHLP